MREDGRGNEEGEMGGEAKQTCIIVPERRIEAGRLTMPR
jgi:hypothetical protein